MEKLGLRLISIIATMVLMASLGILVTRSKEPRWPVGTKALKAGEPEAAQAVLK